MAGAMLALPASAQSLTCVPNFVCRGFEDIAADIESGTEVGFAARLSCGKDPGTEVVRLRLPKGKEAGFLAFGAQELPLHLEAESSQSLYMALRPAPEQASVLVHFDLAEHDMTTMRITRNGPAVGRFSCRENG